MPPPRIVTSAITATNLLCLALLAHGVFERLWTKNADRDFALNVRQSGLVVATSSYDGDHDGRYVFCYPLPAAIGFAGLGKLGPEVSTNLWRVMLAGSFTLSCWRILQLLEWTAHPLRFAVLWLAWQWTGIFIQFDLRFLNCNTLCLALVLEAAYRLREEQPAHSGVLLGVAAAIKLYSGVFLLWWLVQRKWTATRWMFATLAALFLVLPILSLGRESAWNATASWFDAVASTGSMETPFAFPADIASLHRALLAIFSQRGAWKTNHAIDWDEQVVFGVSRFIQAILLLAAIGFLFRPPSAFPSVSPCLRRLLDVTVLMVAPLVISPIMQRHHATAAFVLATITIGVVLGPNVAWPDRIRLSVLPSVGNFLIAVVYDGRSEPLSAVVTWIELFLLLASAFFATSVYAQSSQFGETLSEGFPSPARQLPIAGSPVLNTVAAVTS